MGAVLTLVSINASGLNSIAEKKVITTSYHCPKNDYFDIKSGKCPSHKIGLVKEITISNEIKSVSKKPFTLSQAVIEFKIQIISLAGYLPANATFFKNCGHADEYVINNVYKYTVGKFANIEDAQKATDALKKKGYKDAFPVAFINGHLITADEAVVTLNNK